MFFKKQKNDEDVTGMENMLRGHADQMPGPSEEFKGRLEMRLARAWEARGLDGASAQRPGSWFPMFRFAGTVFLLALVAAGVTTRLTSPSPSTLENAPMTSPRAQMFGSALRAPGFSAMSEAAPLPAIQSEKSVLQDQNTALMTAGHESPQRPVWVRATLWFLAYLCLFSALIFLIRGFKKW